MYTFKLPDLGEGIHEGEILKWHVDEGGVVESDAPLVDVETDKAAVTIPSPAAGRVTQRSGAVGEIVTVGSVLVIIDDGQGEAPAPEVEAAAAPAAKTPVAPKLAAHGSGPVPAAPATRRLARELGVDLRRVPPTGPAGRVTNEDVRRFAAGLTAEAPAPVVEAPAAPVVEAPSSGPGIPFFQLPPTPDFTRFGPVDREPIRSIRRKTAQRMVTSMTVVPHVAHMDEADVTDLNQIRRAARAQRADEPGGRLTLMPFILKAVAAGLREFPEFNASLDPVNEEIIYKRYFNLGFAADTDRGLVVPVIDGCDRRSVMGLSARMIELAERARAGRLEPGDMQGGCFTVTNVGAIGGTAVIPTINYPEVAILGLGRVQQKPVVRDGEIVIREMLPMTLAFDHRVADGASAARFMAQLVRRLSDPQALLLEV